MSIDKVQVARFLSTSLLPCYTLQYQRIAGYNDASAGIGAQFFALKPPSNFGRGRIRFDVTFKVHVFAFLDFGMYQFGAQAQFGLRYICFCKKVK